MNIENWHAIRPTARGGYNNHGQHKTKFVVKILSGEEKGCVIPCDSEEDARIINFFLSDHGICGVIKAPIYSSLAE